MEFGISKAVAKNKNRKFKKGFGKWKERPGRFVLPQETKQMIIGVLLILIALIIALSFFGKAGKAGHLFMGGTRFLIGETVFVIPLIFILGGLAFLNKKTDGYFFEKERRIFWPIILAILILILGVTGILGGFNPQKRMGGLFGYIISWPLLKYFGFWATQLIFLALIIIGGLIFWQILRRPSKKKGFGSSFPEKEVSPKVSIIRKIFSPKFKVKEIPPFFPREIKQVEKEISPLKLETKPISGSKAFSYQPPPLDLLEPDRGSPASGDTRINSAIIKKTLQNFGIVVTMSEINIGPTVTQYTLKPAEGVKLSKITALSNDLALALASHPIRIEAPVPGRSLVGIEVPNKVRSRVGLRNLIEDTNFQKSYSNLIIALGKDVSGVPVYADLTRMPHLLVAGSTGTGKTCAADTLMFTEKGMLTFEELCPLPLNSETDFKIRLITRDGIETTGKNYNNGICQFYKLSTSRGYQIEATTEHPFWVMNEDGSQGWKAASLIKKGDFVAISRGPDLFGDRTDLSDFKPSKIKAYHREISFPKKMTPQLAEFLGLLTADGGLSVEKGGTHRVVYTQANSHLIRLYKKSLKELFGITQFIEKRSGSNPKNRAFDIVIGSKHLKEFLAYLGMDSCKSPQKEIPRAIREAPKEIVTAYLRALFDNDGYVGKNSVELCISSKRLISQIHVMLLNFGIISSLNVKKVKNYPQNEYYRLSVFGEEARKFIKEIGFIRKEKYKNLPRFARQNLDFGKVKSYINSEINKVKKFLKLSPNPNVDLIPYISSLPRSRTSFTTGLHPEVLQKKGLSTLEIIILFIEKFLLRGLIRRMGQKYLNRFARLTNRGWRYQSGILVPKYAFSSLRSYNSGFRVPGYQSLERILDFYQPISEEPEYQELKKIRRRNFYWDKIEKIDRTSGVGYDFYVPGSDSFVGNGFVNHNTIFLNSLILSLLYQPSTAVKSASPEILRFILVDPKRVEFPVYENLPHLLCPVIYNATQTIGVLKWLTGEMERRFDILSEAKAKDIGIFNEMALKEGIDPLPFIILIIDELADLMAAKGREIEAGIVRLAQMARAVGIHLVVATQRPSVEVITGLIKANITSRITFQVASQVDSRTVLDTAGAEKLLGLGDMLYVSAEVAKPKRIQGAYISDKEVRKVTKHIISNNEAKESQIEMDADLIQEMDRISGEPERGVGFYEGEDQLYEEAKRKVIEARKASASLLQRRLRIGYARAARLIDMLEEKGIVGPGEGAKPREVYGDLPSEPLSEPQSKPQNDENNWEKV